MKAIRSADIASGSEHDSVSHDFLVVYAVVAAVMAVFAILFAYNEVMGVPVQGVGLMLGVSSLLLFLHVASFLFYLYDQFDPKRRFAHPSDSVLGIVLYFVISRSTLYTLTMFGYALALYHQSWLYRPLLAAALVTLTVIVVSFLPIKKTEAGRE